ncbi:DUF2283 domain-containing protein [Bacillus haynesii]|uniref:DUF2283 domain-containing protein n=2 Tax=Bacillus haynesii TaxID=1925021 RepID=UPI0022820E8E|nr:DUF2283 domain-containing protein [Bacillus haynesii]MCY8217383.1 DUF2283 domain-containing protein [Bacillus haynesii]MCY8610464.1 DUF2283 domain-containing protein [Bacillus haynesii]MCY8711687.1 DUF2283 domain-containing protein [Bacillus haynesii]MCY8742011.1 DUF2283 domain-containing protein [Bacillus haynesii]MCY9149326.1 DUF2283 domain-containing protein [Bacillus haynesii]
MNIFISFDVEADMGYIALTESRAGSAAATDEIGNTALAADFDRHQRIIGVEFPGEAAPEMARLGTLTGRKHKLEPAFLNGARVQRFRPTSQEAVKTILVNGVQFYFADHDGRHFIGFDVMDQAEKSE